MAMPDDETRGFQVPSDEVAAALRDIAASLLRLASAVAPPPPPTPIASLPAARQTAPLQPWISKREAAAYLGVSVRCLTNWQRDRGLPFTKVRSMNHYRRDELNAWMARQRDGKAS
jgi:excisionase family DNA binding protein